MIEQKDVIAFFDERAGDYEDAANVLAYRALQEKNEDYARRALWILYLIAEQTRDIFETRPGEIRGGFCYAFFIQFPNVEAGYGQSR